MQGLPELVNTLRPVDTLVEKIKWMKVVRWLLEHSKRETFSLPEVSV